MIYQEIYNRYKDLKHTPLSFELDSEQLREDIRELLCFRAFEGALEDMLLKQSCLKLVLSVATLFSGVKEMLWLSCIAELKRCLTHVEKLIENHPKVIKESASLLSKKDTVEKIKTTLGNIK
jgi:hypothetical protein